MSTNPFETPNSSNNEGYRWDADSDGSTDGGFFDCGSAKDDLPSALESDSQNGVPVPNTIHINKANLVSPFELALAEAGESLSEMQPSRSNGSFVSAASTESEIGTKIENFYRRKSLQQSTTTLTTLAATKKRKNSVLKNLEGAGDDESGAWEDGLVGSGTPWAKLILLEELGTATSWAILLIPYLTFVVALVLDTYSDLLVSSLGPLSASHACVDASLVDVAPVGHQHAYPGPCSYPFTLRDGPGALSHSFATDAFDSIEFQKFMERGVAFSSGPIRGVPPMSVALRGDASFINVSSYTLDLVATKSVITSTVVAQQSLDDVEKWIPVSISDPAPLSLACDSNSDLPYSQRTWNCASPRIIDVLFAMPRTSVLSGSDIQVHVLYSYHDGFESKGISELPELDDSENFIQELVTGSRYFIEHESPLDAKINALLRLGASVCTIFFLIFWCWSFGSKWICNLLVCENCWGFHFTTSGERSPLRTGAPSVTFWWESPWILFPERIYLLFLLASLVMLQNPFVVYGYFWQDAYNSASFRSIIDAVSGTGLHLFLMLWLCVFQGLRYHTAEVARRRAKQQRQVLELRRAARYIAEGSSHNYGTEEYITNYTHEFYDLYGDVDGTGTYGVLEIRVKSDPFGDYWADFLLPKLFLLTMGLIAVWLASRYRFPSNKKAVHSDEAILRYNAIYLTSSLANILILFFWAVLIVRSAIKTGSRLRREPFLSTRPVQLAFRVLLGILFLSFAAVIVPFSIDLYDLIVKLKIGEGGQPRSRKVSEVLMFALIHVSEFPYSGTASGIGAGKILVSTVCAMIAALIFLPSRTFKEAHHSGTGKKTMESSFTSMALVQRGRRKQDKRIMVTLARKTHTWRIFPLPIKPVTFSSDLVSDASFKYDKVDRCVAFVGKYTPVFCLETACWLLEASWQTYYSSTKYSTDNFAPGRMTLESIGLKLEEALFDEATHTQAYVATNVTSQVDGEQDSIIVVAFRGTANVRNMSTDLKMRQVPLLDQIIGIGHPVFQVSHAGIQASEDEWFWDSPFNPPVEIKSYVPESSRLGCLSLTSQRVHHKERSPLSSGAKALLKANPMTRQALACVHEGFLEAYSHIRRQLWESILQVMKRQLAKAVERRANNDVENTGKERAAVSLPRVYVTGHSLGGSLAQLLALDLASNCHLVIDSDIDSHHSIAEGVIDNLDPTHGAIVRSIFAADLSSGEGRSTMRFQPPICVYTFGQPKVGNHAFARLYKERVPHTFRVATEGDAFTTMPTTLMCGGIYKGAGLEVVLDEGLTGNILVGPTIVETLFRFSNVRTSVTAHSLERYRDSLESGFSQAELEEYYKTRVSTKSASDSPGGDGMLGRKVDTGLSDPLPHWLTQVKPNVREEWK